MDYRKIVQDVIVEHKAAPVDMLGIGDGTGEYNYLNALRASYVRTLRDIDRLYAGDRSSRRILEIGSFLGAVSISLKKLGYDVSAVDIPEFHASDRLRALYARHAIAYHGLNLKSSKLPFEPESQDVVIACEVMEHLNFNPLPALQEISRVLKKDGHFYVAMPNQSNIVNRVKLLLGKSIHNPIDDYFKQLDRNDNMIVGLHWREYTLPETVELLERMGFTPVRKYYFTDTAYPPPNIFKSALKGLACLFPPFRPSQVVIGRKVATPAHDFWLTDANS